MLSFARRVVRYVRTKVKAVKAYIPKWLHDYGGALMTATGLLTVAASAFVPIVHAIGFSSPGVVAGSVAAFIQSAIYQGATVGVFSSLQSFGAKTVAVGTTVNPGLLGIGVIVLVGGAWMLWRRYSN